MPSKGTERVIELVRKAGIFRPKDLDPHGIPREYLMRLYRKGVVQRVGRGLYTLADADISEHYSLAEAGKRIPQGVICLLSALRFHGLTTQAPFQVWMAIDVKARKPKGDGLPLHIVRFSGDSLRSGIEEHLIQGVTIKVYNPAKTVADCFKYRNKIGLDVALEALRECWLERRCVMDDLWHYAKMCRVANVMRPYLESLP
ncbi:type IV toxin-antitoxin system AbiEi family antitoxin domain-containing protein [Desulfoferrobacter suflitae]|uniref:type IV toxin-antitoxin system AbiEi family antitoxin domain-containing protein n=1 Tax=Desulfoferrobacter suflitae TaxID=2865782 RepID=UPI002164B22C|nr:type IV toxin-antitoxin system AbiEi family antitoxin domain-containing protein [Desulfoferrobacter suflitae]MCK8603793.1 type IV toxin-antitoxin system AbiEi family antitoxin domain-containing protein [Desulfoferrobacter suflitae]